MKKKMIKFLVNSCFYVFLSAGGCAHFAEGFNQGYNCGAYGSCGRSNYYQQPTQYRQPATSLPLNTSCYTTSYGTTNCVTY